MYLYLVLFHSIGGCLVVFHFVLIVVFATCFILLQFLVELVVLVCCVSDLLYVVLLHFVISSSWGWGLFVCCDFLSFVAVMGAFFFFFFFFCLSYFVAVLGVGVEVVVCSVCDFALILVARHAFGAISF